MIEADKRKAIFLLHQEGMSIRKISRSLGLARNTVREIIEKIGEMPQVTRKDKQWIDPELLRRLYDECEGRIQRVHEKLVEEEQIQVNYSTLTRMLRELGISRSGKTRCDRVPDEPGVEMQHDTSVYRRKVAGKMVILIASLLYMRYSKRRYLKFYRVFNRFKMKCFFHEALMFWGYASGQCIIDNTNLARWYGTGKNAVIVPEMKAFGKQYGFRFRCHAKGHANRKAGEERSFWTVETNFFPGRTFQSFEDLNQQAFEWSTVRMDNRPQGKAGLIPAKAFEYERGYLVKLPVHLPSPYQVDERGTDQYGYISFAGNFYWVPGTKRDQVKILEYSDRLKIYQARKCVAEYRLPAHGVKNARFSPEGLPAPRHQPNNRKKPTEQEEKRLRAMDESVNAYLDFALKPKGFQRHQFLRKLFALSAKMTPEFFIKSIKRAHQYTITSVETIERIAVLCLNQDSGELPFVEVDEEFRQRDAYREGSLTDPPDLSIYEKLFEVDDE
jgi:transposase